MLVVKIRTAGSMTHSAQICILPNMKQIHSVDFKTLTVSLQSEPQYLPLFTLECAKKQNKTRPKRITKNDVLLD